jgi:hypothetical protein
MSYKPPATREGDEPQWTRKHSRDDAETITMYSITASFTKKVAEIDARQEIESLLADAKDRIQRAPLTLVKPSSSGYLLEVSLPDLHMGKLAWNRETRHGNYDLEIATETCYRAIETLLARSAHMAYERVLLVVGNDLLNSDSDTGTTTRGTPQDNDGRFFRTFQRARQVKVAVAERLARDVAPVDIVVMPGNHDRLSTLHIGDSLSCWFHNDPRVTVDCEPTPRKYYRWGQVLLGITHGDELKKPADLAGVMSNEQAAIWGACRFKEWHIAHWHRDAAQKDEIRGVKIRLLPTLAAADNYHNRNGYIGNMPSAESFIWHKEEGLVGTAFYTAPEQAA